MPELITRPDGTVLELIETVPVDLTPEGRRPARTKARKQALDVLYAAELRGVPAAEVLAELATDPEVTVRPFARELVSGVIEGQARYDAAIEAALSPGWTLDRMPRIDRCLARLAVHELSRGETDAGVVIAEAVRLAQEFSTDDSGAFLNGVLAQVLRQRS